MNGEKYVNLLINQKTLLKNKNGKNLSLNFATSFLELCATVKFHI